MKPSKARPVGRIFRAAEPHLPECSGAVPPWGPYITAHFEPREDVELFYAEIIVPEAGAQRYIYWSLMNPVYGKHPSYAGIQMQNTPGADVHGNNICSVWDSSELPGDALPEVTLVGGPHGIYWDHFGGEGTGLHTSNTNAWKPGQRYAMAIRRWTRKGDDMYTYTSMFMYSFHDGTWAHWMSARVPGTALMLEGDPAGFLERYAGSALHYYGHFGNYFKMLKGGHWQQPKHYSIGAGKAPWLASLVNGPSGHDIKVQVGNTPEREQEIILIPTQQSMPTIITKTIVHSINATYNVEEQTLQCTWVIDNTSPPPIKTLISVSRDKVYGKDIHLEEIMGPSARQALITNLLLREEDNKGKYKFYLRIEHYDIFEQKSNNGYTQIIFIDTKKAIEKEPHEQT